MRKQEVRFEDVEPGMELPRIEYGPWSNAHIVRWCAAQENWERFHYDYKFAAQCWGLTDVVANGNWRKHAIARLLKDWTGQGGWLWRLALQYRYPHYPGDVLTAWARAKRKREVDGFGIVELDCGMTNQESRETTPGSATVVLPLRSGREVPYPFAPPASLQGWCEYRQAKNIDNPWYATEEVRSYIGWVGEEVESWDEVCTSELRRFAQAIPDPDPLYWDEDRAQGTRFGTIMAMPLFPVDAFKPPPTENDYLTANIRKDPHFWGGPPADSRGVRPVIPGLPGRHLNAGQSYEILELARLGQKLRRKSRLLDIYERQGSPGRLIFMVTETSYWNNNGRLILEERSTTVQRG